jgi:hypothetical protein
MKSFIINPCMPFTISMKLKKQSFYESEIVFLLSYEQVKDNLNVHVHMLLRIVVNVHKVLEQMLLLLHAMEH